MKFLGPSHLDIERLAARGALWFEAVPFRKEMTRIRGAGAQMLTDGFLRRGFVDRWWDAGRGSAMTVVFSGRGTLGFRDISYVLVTRPNVTGKVSQSRRVRYFLQRLRRQLGFFGGNGVLFRDTILSYRKNNDNYAVFSAWPEGIVGAAADEAMTRVGDAFARADANRHARWEARTNRRANANRVLSTQIRRTINKRKLAAAGGLRGKLHPNLIGVLVKNMSYKF